MLATLTGLGLSSAAGLNAYIPLLAVGLIARFTDLIPLGSAWQWLEHPVTLVVLTVLLVIEFGADKIPALDSVNDIVQTVVRPSAGGITFGAGASAVDLAELTGSASAASAAGAATGDGVSWGPVIAGMVVALVFHAVKTLARPILNSMSFGAAAPVVSLVEDVASFLTSMVAILLPLLILVVFPLMVLGGVWVVRRRRRRRARKAGRDGAPA
jgi:hypothetical protein